MSKPESNKKRIVLLCSDDAHQKYLISLFTKLFQVVLIVVEPAKYQREQLLKRKKYLDYFYSWYHLCRRTVFGLNRYRRRYFLCDYPPQNNPIHTVKNINDISVAELIEKTMPDLMVIMCTSILKDLILNTVDTIINIHGGYLPNYRGNHCFFFAMYNKEFDKVGSTIHFVDKGIDTGDIIAYVVPPIDKHDTPETLYCKSEKLAIHQLADLIKKNENGEPFPRVPQKEKFKLYNNRDRTLIKELFYNLKS